MNRDVWAVVRPILSDTLNGSRRPGPDSVARFLARFRAAQAQGMAWPDALQEEALRRLVLDEQKRIAKEESVVTIEHAGRPVRKSTRVGARKRGPETGVEHFEQLTFADMAWPEVFAWEELIKSQIDGLRANRTMVARLKQLQARVPDSTGPGDAAQRLGTTVAEWLAS